MFKIMRKGNSLRFYGMFLNLVLFSLLSPATASTEPSQACRDLARQFAERPEQLNDTDLARLRQCVQTELNQRVESQQPATRRGTR
jgi:hypothetical protein